MSLDEQSRKLDTEIRRAVEEAVEDLRTELRRRFEEALDQVSLSLPEPLVSEQRLSGVVQPAVDRALAEQPDAPSADATELRDAVVRLDAARSQAQVLRTLLEEAARFASRSAVFLIRDGVVRGYDGHGFDVDWAEQRVDPSQGAWRRLLDGRGAQILSSSERADLASRLEAPVASEGVLIPMVLRDRIAAALYADRAGDELFDAPALQTLAYVGALTIETLPLRERPETSTLTLGAPPQASGEAPAPESVPEAAPPAPEAREPMEEVPEPEVEIEVEEEPELAVSEDTDLGAADLGEVDLEVEEEVAPTAPMATEAVAPEVEEVEEAGWKVEEEEPTAEPVPRPAESVPEPTPPGAGEPPPPPPAEASEEPPPVEAKKGAASPASAGAPQVQPPEDVQGPGWAFSSTPQQDMDDEEEARHEEARRLARLLISEIKLYNEDQVQEGRKNNDIVERLKEDLDRSRQLYEERVDPRVREKTDYFYQEMVRLLGAGDPKTLGI